MKKLAFSAALAFSALTAHAAPSGGNDTKDSVGDFFKAFNAQPNAFAEYRFLTSPAVQDNERTRNLATQLLATELSFLGRPRDALQVFPLRGASETHGNLPVPSNFVPMPATEWIAGQADGYRVVMVNEAHHVPQTRLLSFALLQALRAKGYTHFAVEALRNNGTDPMRHGYPVRETGIYTREPVFAELLREARRLGYILVPYEPVSIPGQTQQQRETGMAATLATLVRAQPDAKVLVHAGYGHIGKTAGSQPGGADPMALEFMRLSGLPILTVDQTRLALGSGATADPLARTFGVQVPAVLVSRQDHLAWSVEPKRFDASVLLPATDISELRPGWLTLGGRRQPVAVDLTPCIAHLPCLAEAHYASEGDDAIPADQFVLLADGETNTPLYLAPGQYRLRLTGPDDTVLVERTLDVPAHRPSPSDTP